MFSYACLHHLGDQVVYMTVGMPATMFCLNVMYVNICILYVLSCGYPLYWNTGIYFLFGPSFIFMIQASSFVTNLRHFRVPPQCLVSQENICFANSSLSCIEPLISLPMVNLLSYPITDNCILVPELRFILACFEILPKWLIISFSSFFDCFLLAKEAPYPYNIENMAR